MYNTDGKDILVEISDDGIGIPDQYLNRIFERFFRTSGGRSKEVKGSGLGLAISKHIIEAHGHTIHARSKEGLGTTIGFTLQPYSQVAGSVQNSDNKDIVRNAHGWIKNHSLYRG